MYTVYMNFCYPFYPIVQLHYKYELMVSLKTVWILISWLLFYTQRPADLDLHCIQKRVYDFKKSNVHHLVKTGLDKAKIFSVNCKYFLTHNF